MSDVKMNPKVKDKWLVDLLDNPNKQGKGSLRDGDDFYCCWGRLCNLHPNSQWRFDHSEGKYSCGDTKTFYFPPHFIQEWADIQSSNPRVTIEPDDLLYDEIFNSKALLEPGNARHGKPIQTTLAMMNDTGFTFAQIAGIIERYL